MKLSSSFKFSILAIVLLIAFVALGDVVTMWRIQKAKDREAAPLWDQLNSRSDDLGFDSFLRTSTIEAETFRQSLLAKNEGQPSDAELIGQACLRFREIVNSGSSNESGDSGGGPTFNLSHFELKPDQFVDAIKGTRSIPDPQTFYGSFAGKWYGLWEENEVDHHWGDYVKLEQPLSFVADDSSTGDDAKGSGGAKVDEAPDDRDSVNLIGYQYAWVGDGYGLNHVAQSVDGKENFLLGYVIHVKDKDLEKEVIRRPHVGVIDGTDRLIWITKGEVFFEESISDSNGSRYFITGFRYEIKSDENGKRLLANDGFQAVYSRAEFPLPRRDRMPWRGFEVSIDVGEN